VTGKKVYSAAEDLKYLLDRSYPKTTALNLVVNHYKLDRDDRNFLVRYVFSEEDIKTHRSRLVPVEKIRGKDIVVDTYNVLIISENILAKKKIVEGMDGFVRDHAAVFSHYRFGDRSKKTVGVILETLKGYEPNSILFILDSQMSRSGELAAYIRSEMKKRSILGDALTKNNADGEIKKLNRITLTSDSVIIERVDVVVDLGRVLLEKSSFSARTRQ
jgi:hypothetical protein